MPFRTGREKPSIPNLVSGDSSLPLGHIMCPPIIEAPTAGLSPDGRVRYSRSIFYRISGIASIWLRLQHGHNVALGGRNRLWLPVTTWEEFPDTKLGMDEFSLPGPYLIGGMHGSCAFRTLAVSTGKSTSKSRGIDAITPPRQLNRVLAYLLSM